MKVFMLWCILVALCVLNWRLADINVTLKNQRGFHVQDTSR